MQWNVQYGGQNYEVKYEKRKIYVNGEKIKKRRVTGNVLEQGYHVPLGSDSAVLYISERIKNNPVLTINGCDVLTNMPYEPARMPKWGYVFIGLYVLNFILLLGGALGAALAVVFCGLSFQFIADKNMKTSAKVWICIALYLADVLVSIATILLLSGVLSQIG